MGKTIFAGLDLSKNHFGLTLLNNIDKDNQLENLYSYVSISNMTKKQVKETNDAPYCVSTTAMGGMYGPDKTANYAIYDIRINPRLNRIEMDAVKSIAINKLILYIFRLWTDLQPDDELFVSLEDYIVMNNGIVSLVHTTEDFKYRFLSSDYDYMYPKNRTLFLCCNSTWKKLLGKEASAKPTGKDRYENIKNYIKNNEPECYDILTSALKDKSEDVRKDIIDSWALAKAGMKRDLPLFRNYSKRLFKYNENERTITNDLQGFYRDLSEEVSLW